MAVFTTSKKEQKLDLSIERLLLLILEALQAESLERAVIR